MCPQNTLADVDSFLISHLPALHSSGLAMCRVATHLVTSDEPHKKADVKAALATKDSQGRRGLLSSVTGA